MVTHLLLIDVKTRRRFLEERAFLDEFAEVLSTLGVDLVVVFINAFRTLDLRPADMKKGDGIPLRQFPGLGGVDHIVRNGGQLAGDFGFGTIGLERLDLRHDSTPEVKERMDI